MMRLAMMLSLSMLGLLAATGCQSSHPTTQPSIADDCDCCKTAALRSDPGTAAFAAADAHIKRSAELVKGIDAAIGVSTYNIEHAGQTAFLARRADVDADGTVRSRVDTEQGALEDMHRPLDVGIQGEGFFKVKVTDRLGDGFAYTRNGNFFQNDRGELVLGVGDGYKLHPPLKLPANATEIVISQSGIVEYKQAGSTTLKQAGHIELAKFVNPQGLACINDHGLYVETADSGAPINCKVGEDEAGITLQGFLEASNVNVQRERQRIEYLRNWRETVRSTAVADAHP
jgi:flagellar basal body rod protein FlgG